jgi:S-formylglutathione hydrolase FrmB
LLGAAMVSTPLLAQRGTISPFTVPSRALAANLVGDPPAGKIEVYLPRTYHRQRSRRYPVLYLLHGIAGTSRDWTGPGYQGMTIQGLMDSLTAARAIREMIVVVPTAFNAYVGSYYSNSPVTGNWEDYLARELVSWVDSAFRTIPNAASRGIAGHSMGGFGTIRMAMRHADVFSAAYAMAPCCLALGQDIGPTNEAWRRMPNFPDRKSLLDAIEKNDFYPVAIVAFAAVMSPNPNKPPLFVDLPYRPVGDSVVPVEDVVARWQANFPVAQVGRSREMLLRLRAPLRIDYGFDDQFPHIPPSVRILVDSLAAYRVPHRVDAYDGDHRNRIRQRMTEIVLPFFSAVLSDRR